MKIQKSAEDYLEAVLAVTEQRGYCRSIELAEQLGVTKPSVSVAVKRLRENGYLRWDEDKHLYLTPEGEKIAKSIYTRHKKLTDIFIYLGVDPEIAREDACKIEHDISEQTFDAICRFSNLHGLKVKENSKSCKDSCPHPGADC